MNRQIINQRCRKANTIIGLYDDRNYRHEDISKNLKIPKNIVARVTREFNYEHTKHIVFENRNENQKINMVVDYGAMDYLDNYDF